MARTDVPLLLLAILATSYGLAEARSLLASKPTSYILVIFGDSVSDTGNDFKAVGVPDPSVYTSPNGLVKGRFTNGYNWVDYLANATFSRKVSVKVMNYAYGGATACQSSLMEAFVPFTKNLTAQTQAFLADVKAGKVTVGPKTKLLVLQWIGMNDFLYPLEQAVTTGQLLTDSQVAALTQATVGCRLASIQALAAALPGILTDVAVLPIAPLHMSPEMPPSMAKTIIALENAVGSATVAAVAALQAAFNASIPGTPGYGVKMHPIGTTGRWIANGVKKVEPPFLYTNVSCFVNPVSSLAVTPGTKVCSNPDDHLFFDTSHLVSRFHRWFALQGLLPRLQRLRLLPK